MAALIVVSSGSSCSSNAQRLSICRRPRSATISASLCAVGSQDAWLTTVVHGPQPQSEQEKVVFLDELLQFRSTNRRRPMICGDFNMIYQAADKNNDRLDRRAMRRFRSFLNQAQLQEVDLVGRRFTWSNHQGAPTLERLDRVFESVDWFERFPTHCFKALSSDCSDHSPLFLFLCSRITAKRHFRFESFWTKLSGFHDAGLGATNLQRRPMQTAGHQA